MNKKWLISICLVSVIALIAILAPAIAPHDPYENNIARRLEPRSREYLCGTDELGRCVLSRLIYGTRNTLEIALVVMLLASFLGITFGCIAGYVGGRIDKGLMIVFDLFMAFPPFVYVMVLIGLMGNDRLNLILSMTMFTWVISTKMVRSKVRIEKQKEYVGSARIYGASHSSIIIKHILPNIIKPLIVFFSTQMGDIILLISGFSFLGLGMSADIPEWGTMISTAKNAIYTSPLLMVYPGICIFLSVFACNALAENMQEKVEG